MAADSSPFRSLATTEALRKRIERLERALNQVTNVLADIELRGLFVMHKVQLTRKKRGGLILGGMGKPETETVTLLQMYDAERDTFAAMVMGQAQAEEEQRVKDSQGIEDASEQLARAQSEGAAANAHTNGAGPSVTESAPPELTGGTGRQG